MSKLDVLRDYSKRGAYDEIWTPEEAWLYLKPCIPTTWWIWDCAPGDGRLINHINKSHYVVQPRYQVFWADGRRPLRVDG